MEDFWVNNYKILFDEWYHIFPDKNMSRNKILNSLTRFSIITLIIFYFINSSFAWYIIPLIILICCIFFGFNNKKIKLELESDEIDSKNNELKDNLKNFNRFFYFGIILMIQGFFLSVNGFRKWKFKVQDKLDKKLDLELNG